MSTGPSVVQKERRVQVTFWPEGDRVRVPLETTLLDAAKIAGVDLASSCGGDGLCGKCRVIVRQGNVTAQPTSMLSREEIRRGYVLGCQTKVVGDVEVEIPPESRAEAAQILIDVDAQRFRALHPIGRGNRGASRPSDSQTLPQVATSESGRQPLRSVQAISRDSAPAPRAHHATGAQGAENFAQIAA